MQKWEYLTQEYACKTPGLITGSFEWDWKGINGNLHSLGEQGWELISAYPLAHLQGLGSSGVTSQVVFIFKRPKD
jgi:hypothetical protein